MFWGYDATRVPLEEPALYRDLWKQGDAFLTCSEFIRGRIVELGAPEEKTFTVGNPVDPQRFPFRSRGLLSGEPASILFVGNRVEVKGVC
jgi:glycosyltransferase involved in cell wall biosynthesis